VTLEKAELLLVGWGWAEQVPLRLNGGNLVRLNFDFPELRSAVGDKNPSDVLLFVRAKDMAACDVRTFHMAAFRQRTDYYQL